MQTALNALATLHDQLMITWNEGSTLKIMGGLIVSGILVATDLQVLYQILICQ